MAPTGTTTRPAHSSSAGGAGRQLRPASFPPPPTLLPRYHPTTHTRPLCLCLQLQWRA